ncbi:MAG: helix-turn-helix transcriptional regulator [Candidatus Bipolaricaulota bacterium]|nr:MAG: helix-turn-helix transcriptional regulator [Candidatus Bipolaricaulota bacterium]
MVKKEFGTLIRSARLAKGYSLRELADRVSIDYSRLARIEHGNRPAPGLAGLRALAGALDVEMIELIVAAGTSHEVLEHLLWEERLQDEREGATSRSDSLAPAHLRRKNRFAVEVIARDGARCTAKLGEETLELFRFDRAAHLVAGIPPESVMVARERDALECAMVDNSWAMVIKRVRRLGQVTNLVLRGAGFELNSLHESRVVERLALREGEAVWAGVATPAVSTEAHHRESA